MKQFLRLVLILLLIPVLSRAQHPSYYTLGENELEGLSIYDLYHNSKGILFIATDKGVYRYNGHQFDKIDIQNSLSHSYFDLTGDRKDNVFFYNLSGQFFKLHDNSCELFYSIPDSLMYSDIDFGFDNNNNLIIACKKIISISEEKEATIISNSISGRLGYYHSIAPGPDSSLMITGYPNNIIAYYKSGKFDLKQVHVPAKTIKNFGLLENKQQNIAYFTANWQMFTIQNDSLKPLINPGSFQKFCRLYTTSGNVWVATNTNSIYKFSMSDPNTKADTLFPNIFISTVEEDHESNILFGTFGNGIKVIPNINTTDLNTRSENYKIISISKISNTELVFGTENGKVLTKKSDGSVKILRNKSLKNIEFLKYLGNNKLLIADQYLVIYDLKSNTEKKLDIGSIKDVWVDGSDTCIFASNRSGGILNFNTLELSDISALRLRLYCIARTKPNRFIYAGSSKGLSLVTDSKNSNYLTFKNNIIIAHDIETISSRAYIATSSFGILVYEKDKLLAQWKLDSAGIPNCNKIKSAHNRMFIATSRGVYITDLNGVIKNVVNKSSGLYAENISDFEIQDSLLTVIHSKGVQTINLNSLKPANFLPEITLEKILVNDSLTLSSKTVFNHLEKNFSFHLYINSLKYRDEISILYFLEGADNKWQYNTFDNNIISYKSLSDGDYTFTAIPLFRGKRGKEIVYSFTIHPPYWKTWWFIVIIFLVALGIISLFFIGYLKRLREKSKRVNELNNSRLTAIQSQMNPHFIFNALNSIQDLVLKKDVEQSYDYITKFANLIRSTLNYSDKEFIDFNDELNLIELYLSIEKMRFKNELFVTVESNGISDIMVPPMLIQPFIENALVHGLLHKEGKKTIRVTFALNESLTCVIEDNGIGRARAKEIKLRQKKTHESFSGEAIKKRFEILRQNFGGNLSYTYQDLVENDTAAGTRVTIIIPFKRRF